MIIDKYALFEGEVDIINYVKAITPRVKGATVIELTRDGEPIIQFDGDSLPSKKLYKYLNHYNPTVGDRVVLINNIIHGGLKP